MTKSQQKEIDIAKRKGIDTTLFENEEFNAKQMHEIRMGLEEGLDVSIYARPDYEVEKMEIYRMLLRHNLCFGTDIPVDLLFYDLNAKECNELYKIAFNDNYGQNYEARYDFHNPVDRENLKQRAINKVREESTRIEPEFDWTIF